MTDPQKYVIGLVFYPGMTSLDIVGPQQVFSALPNVTLHRIWKTLDPIVCDAGLSIVPDTTFADCHDPAPPFDTGSPEKAGPDLVNKAMLYMQKLSSLKLAKTAS